MSGESSGCDCREARAWRAYWTREAIAERLAAELDLYRRICHERWTAVIRDSKRPEARLYLGDYPTHAELTRRRREVKPLDPP